MKLHKLLILIIAISGVSIFTQCKDDDKDIVEDIDQTAALKNVEVTYDSLTYVIGLPEGALSGRPFDSLVMEDSAKYTNPENYSITTIANMTADNTKSGAKDAKFDGMIITIVMDTIESGPIEPEAGEFEVKAGATEAVQAADSINLKTHRLTGLYIFRQTVDGNDLATTFAPTLLYKIGSQEGTIPIPEFYQDIPTRASPEMKEFLSGLLDSGIFDEPIQP